MIFITLGTFLTTRRVNPSIAFYSCLVCQVIASLTTPFKPIDWPLAAIASIFAIVGFRLMLLSKSHLDRNEISLDPVALPKTIVASGPYRICRHPFYLGCILLLLGTGTLLSGGLGLFFAGIFSIFLHYYVHIVEEPKLRAHLGSDYSEYASKVSTWLPLPSLARRLPDRL